MSDGEYDDYEFYDDYVDDVVEGADDPVDAVDEAVDEAADDATEPAGDDETIPDDEGGEGVDDEEEVEKVEVSKQKYKKIVIINPENRVTTDILTDKNVAAIITQRAAALERYNDPLIDLNQYPHIRDPVRIAKLELLNKKCPYLLRRRLCDTRYDKDGEPYIVVEIWNPNEMIIYPDFSLDN